MSYDGDMLPGQSTITQPRGLISSVAFASAAEANAWNREGAFVPARWGRDALDLLGDDSREEARAILNHLDPNIDRTQPVKLIKAHNTWGPIADPDGSGQYFVVVIADLECSEKISESASDKSTTEPPAETEDAVDRVAQDG